MATMSTTIAVKTKRVKKEFTVYNEMAMRQNNFVLEYSRTSMSALSGAAAGILGLTGLYGFIFFFIMAFVLSFLLLLKAGSNWSKYFPSRKMLFLSGQFGGLFTYVLFWTKLKSMIRILMPDKSDYVTLQSN